MIMEEDLQHDDTDRKCAFRLHAVSLVDLALYNIAVLADVPWHTLVLVLRVDCVRRSLHMDSICPKRQQSSVEQERDDWHENLEQPHCNLDQPKECADDANHEMKLSVAGFSLVKIHWCHTEVRLEVFRSCSPTRCVAQAHEAAPRFGMYLQAAPHHGDSDGFIIRITVHHKRRI
jgi:hypothetical protein